MGRALTRAALAAFLLLVRVWPRAWFGGLAAVVGALVWPFSRKDRRQLAVNTAQIFGLPAGTAFARMFERQVFRHQIICGLETLRAAQQPAAVTVRGLDELRALVATAEGAGRGHLLVTGHLGSWELCAHYGAVASTRPFHVLAKPPRNAGARAALEGLRRGMGTPVLWTDRKSLLRDMLGALRRQEAVGFVMDQKPEGRQGPIVPFFGRPTAFVSGPAAMAARFNAPVIAIFCLREGPFAYRLLSEQVLPAGHEMKDEVLLTRRMAAAIERAIRLYPEQWTWNYKRWRFDGAK